MIFGRPSTLASHELKFWESSIAHVVTHLSSSQAVPTLYAPSRWLWSSTCNTHTHLCCHRFVNIYSLSSSKYHNLEEFQHLSAINWSSKNFKWGTLSKVAWIKEANIGNPGTQPRQGCFLPVEPCGWGAIITHPQKWPIGHLHGWSVTTGYGWWAQWWRAALLDLAFKNISSWSYSEYQNLALCPKFWHLEELQLDVFLKKKQPISGSEHTLLAGTVPA